MVSKYKLVAFSYQMHNEAPPDEIYVSSCHITDARKEGFTLCGTPYLPKPHFGIRHVFGHQSIPESAVGCKECMDEVCKLLARPTDEQKRAMALLEMFDRCAVPLADRTTA
jgi:hypothetical protein